MADAYQHKNPPKLQDRHKLVIAEYFGNGFNKREALRAAGYAESTVNHSERQIFRHPAVMAEIKRRQRELAETSKVDADWVVKRLKAKADATLEPFLRVDEASGGLYYDFSEATPEQLMTLDEVTTEEYTEGHGAGSRDVKKVKVKVANNLLALDKLARHLGLFKDRVELDASEELITKLAAARARIKMPKRGPDETDTGDD